MSLLIQSFYAVSCTFCFTFLFYCRSHHHFIAKIYYLLKFRVRSNTATTTQSTLVKEKVDATSSLSIPNHIGLSARDGVVVSVQSSHPAYTADIDNQKERQTEMSETEAICDSSCSKQITVLVVFSENGSVTLSNLDVSGLFRFQ